MEMGFAYGDTVIFRQFFGVPTQSMVTYHQKKNELKKSLKRAYTGKSDRFNSPNIIQCNNMYKMLGKRKKRQDRFKVHFKSKQKHHC